MNLILYIFFWYNYIEHFLCEKTYIEYFLCEKKTTYIEHFLCGKNLYWATVSIFICDD